MASSTTYKTKQRAVIERLLQKNGNHHFTVETLLDLLEKNGENVGRTTVYRTLEKLVNDGKVNKYIQSAGESACYQYVKEGQHCHEHFHLKCEECGRLIHLECSHIDELGGHIEESHGFHVNKLKTVLYGICKECAEK